MFISKINANFVLFQGDNDSNSESDLNSNQQTFSNDNEHDDISKTSNILSDLSFENNDMDGVNVVLKSKEKVVENISTNKNVKKTRNRFTWATEKVGNSLDEAVDNIMSEGFKLYDDHDLKCGQKFYFRCGTIPKARKQWCDKRYAVYLPSDSNDIITLTNGLKHNHNDLLEGQKRLVTKEMISFIYELYDNGTTLPSSVLAHIKSARQKYNLFKDEPDPNKRQLEYIHKKYTDEKVKPMKNVGELMDWCQNHSEFPKDQNEAFVLGYESCSITDEMSFRFTMSTPLLLAKIAKRELICIDATYKLNWLGFPLIIMGTIDREKKFHPLIYACSSHERTEDYAFVFKSVKDAIRIHLKKIFSPKTLVSDGANAIRTSFYEVFPNAELDIMCFAHVLRNVRKRPFVSKNNKSLIIDDIKKMQLAQNRKVFDHMAKLFCKKWGELESNFIEYFKAQWLGIHSNWFEGAANYTPSTNNALESHNAVIKRKITFRKRLPLNKFLITMKQMTEDISRQIFDKTRIIAKDPTIKKEMWTKAAMMHADNFKSFKVKGLSNDKTVNVVPSSKCDSNNANANYYKCLVKRDWTSFDEFINFGFQQFWIVTLSLTEWKLSSCCTCPVFFKQNMCKHIIAIAVKENVLEFPEIANPVLLTKRRTAGRIPNAKRALEYQSDENNEKNTKRKKK